MRTSVYITSYNQKRFLIEAIDSVLNQTLKPFEIIIVDDASTDGSQEVIAGYASRYPDLIIPIYHHGNQGVAQTRIDALKAVSGDYVTYVDGDDRLLPRKIELEVETAAAHPEADVVYSNVHYIDEEGCRIGAWIDQQHSSPPTGHVFREAFSRDFPRRSLFRNELVNPECLREVGFYDASLQIYEDWDMKIRLTKHFQVAYCPEPLVEYRHHPMGLSRSCATLHFESTKRIYEKNRSLLEGLPREDRRYIEKSIADRLASLAWRTAVEELRKGQTRRALAYCWECLRHDPRALLDPRPVAESFLPAGVRHRLSSLRDFIHKATSTP